MSPIQVKTYYSCYTIFSLFIFVHWTDVDFIPAYSDFPLSLTFGPNVYSHSVPIKIIDDDIFEEDMEIFPVMLIAHSRQVNLTTSVARVHIKDNDSEQFHADN